MRCAAPGVVCSILIAGGAGLCSAPTEPQLSPLSSNALQIVGLQVALARDAISPGPIDGLVGGQTEAALKAFQQKYGLRSTGVLDERTRTNLPPVTPLFTNYMVTSNDIERLLPVPVTWLGKSLAPRLDYETVLELVSEKTLSHHKLIQALNPSINWTNVTNGTAVTAPNAQVPAVSNKAAFVQIRLGERILQAFGAESNLLAHFPCSIAQRVDKRPVGELHVAVLVVNPNYTFDPAVFPESAEAQEIGRKLTLQPGPNNPVGTVWIGLDRPGYGIHGAPLPEKVGRTESHGCFRLANWNAEHLLKLVSVGTPVIIQP